MAIEIWTAQDLQNIEFNLDIDYILMTDLDMTGFEWTSIDDFTGILDGNNFTIYNLGHTITQMSAIFKSTNGATIKNLNIIDFVGKSFYNNSCTAAISKYCANSNIENCIVKGTTQRIESYYVFYDSLMIGHIYKSIIKDCHVEGSLNCGDYYVAGLVCDVYGDGFNSSQPYSVNTILRCSSNITINNPLGEYIGGLIGMLNKCEVRKCFSTGNINVDNSSWVQVGGLIGWSVRGRILDCYSKVNLELLNGTSNAYIGGLAGGCGYLGTTSGNPAPEDQYHNNFIYNSYSCGNVSADGSVNKGGFMGEAAQNSWRQSPLPYIWTYYTPVIENCYYDTETSGHSDTGKGEPRTTLQMTDPYDDATTYLTWDFVTIWKIKSGVNDGYPYFVEVLDGIPIATPEDLNAIRSTAVHTFAAGTEWEITTAGGLDKSYIQVADIDMQSWGNFVPIGFEGTSSFAFVGLYNGNNFEIQNLYMNSIHANAGAGLFRRLNGTLKNIALINVVAVSQRGTGLLVIEVYSGVIENCSATGTINSQSPKHSTQGGLIGSAGVANSDQILISRCFADININLEKLTGFDRAGSCGILIGYAANHGDSNLYIENCYARGSIDAEKNHHGGLIGMVQSWSNLGTLLEIKNSYSTVYVPPSVSNYGGFIGVLENESWMGDGVVTVSNCYYDSETSGCSDTGKGEPRTTAQMTDPYDEATTYLTWDFANTWKIKSSVNNGYPYLIFQELLVFVRNNPTLFPDSQPYTDGSLIMIPMRYPIIQMGGNIHWDEINFIATVKMEGKTLKIFANTNEIEVNGVIQYVDYTIPIVQDRIVLKAEDIIRFFPKWKVNIDGLSVYYTTKGGIYVRRSKWIPIPISNYENTISVEPVEPEPTP